SLRFESGTKKPERVKKRTRATIYRKMSIPIRKYYNPSSEEWSEIQKRPNLDLQDLEATVEKIFEQVAERGDEAIKEFTEKFDKVRLETLRVSESEINEAGLKLPDDLKR